MPSLRERHLVAELMDADDVDPRELASALAFIRRINRVLGYNRSVIRAILNETANLKGRVSVLDVGAGSGDLLAELHNSGRVRLPPDRGSPAGSPSRSPPTQTFDLIGLDRHATTIDFGAEFATSAGVRFIRGDALALPFPDASIDVVVSTLFLHHLPDEVAMGALREMARVARHTVIVADLLRNRRAYAWISLFTVLASPMVKHDARASVAHAFTLEEARRLATQAGLSGARIARTFGHRFRLTWRR